MKKTLKSTLLAVLAILMSTLFFACSLAPKSARNGADDGYAGEYGAGDYAPSGAIGGIVPDAAIGGYAGIDGGRYGYKMEGASGGTPYTDDMAGYEEIETGETEETDVGKQDVLRPAGLMTASAWDDNKYYDYFLSLYEAGDDPEVDIQDEPTIYPEVTDGLKVGGRSGDLSVGSDEITVGSDEAEDGEGSSERKVSGKFYRYLVNDSWGFDPTNRVKVTVNADGNPVAGAKVSYFDKDQRTLYAVTDANGIAYIFPGEGGGTFTVKSGEYSVSGEYTADGRDVAVDLVGAEQKANVIKLMFVVDVTGSMGDEISYLTSELVDVITRIASGNPQVRIDLALLFYRDDGDSEKMKYHDFMTVTEGTGLNVQLNNISRQFASGGGDYPEALDEALEIAVGADWGDENSTKVLFHVYDAPPHARAENKARYEKAVKAAAEKGIRLNPVLCSGADGLCEYLARQAAIYTAGQFIYVTDDSGIGNSHYDPDIPNAVVERLNDLIVRLVNGYFCGVFAEPVDWRTATVGE